MKVTYKVIVSLGALVPTLTALGDDYRVSDILISNENDCLAVSYNYDPDTKRETTIFHADGKSFEFNSTSGLKEILK